MQGKFEQAQLKYAEDIAAAKEQAAEMAAQMAEMKEDMAIIQVHYRLKFGKGEIQIKKQKQTIIPLVLMDRMITYTLEIFWMLEHLHSRMECG